MDRPNPSKSSNLNAGLSAWCQSKGIDTSSLASQMGFSYMHTWRLIAGKSPVTAETLGRFVLAYGHEAAGELLALSEKPDQECHSAYSSTQKVRRCKQHIS